MDDRGASVVRMFPTPMMPVPAIRAFAASGIRGFASCRRPMRYPARREETVADSPGIARGTVDALPRRPAGRFNRRVAHRLFERAERRQVLGRAPGNEAGPAAVSSEPASESPACSAVRSGVCPIPCGQVSAEAWPSTSELADQGAILALAERLECTAAGSDSGALAQRPYPSRLDKWRSQTSHPACRLP